MRKKSAIVLLMIAMITVLACGTCTFASTEKVSKEPKLKFEYEGTLNMAGFGEVYGIYTFDAPNDDIVAYAINGDRGFITFGKKEWPAETSLGVYACFNNSQFIGVSNKYILFLNENKNIIAVSIHDRKDAKVGESTKTIIAYDELSQEEKDSFIYPNSYDIILNPFRSERIKTMF